MPDCTGRASEQIVNCSIPTHPRLQDAPPQPEELVVQPEYRLEGPGDQPHDEGFEKPVDAAARDERPTSVVRDQPPAVVEIPLQTQPAALPAPAPNVAPRGLKMVEVQQAAPRRAGQPSKFSKRAAESRINPENPVPATPQTEITEEAPAKVLPQVAAVQRQTNVTPATAPDPTRQNESALARRQETVERARRELSDAPSPELSSIPMARQALNQPAATPRSADAAPTTEVSPAMTQAPTVAPQVQTARQQAGGSLISEQPGRNLKMSAAPHGGAARRPTP